jgi:hypothetical protein
MRSCFIKKVQPGLVLMIGCYKYIILKTLHKLKQSEEKHFMVSKCHHFITLFNFIEGGGDNFLIGRRGNRWKTCIHYQPMNIC